MSDPTSADADKFTWKEGDLIFDDVPPASGPTLAEIPKEHEKVHGPDRSRLPDDLIEFWNVELDSPLFWHPRDRDVLEKNEKRILRSAITFDEFIGIQTARNAQLKISADSRLHLSLLPVPFMGNIAKSEIIILLLNPGFSFIDYCWGPHELTFNERLFRNLRQDFVDIDFPFLCLDPEFCWHPGFEWWERKLRQVIGRIACEKFGHNYISALKDLSNKMAAIEMMPYRSASFGAASLLRKLPSVQVARSYVNRIAKSEQKLIIATRRIKDWGLSEGPRVVLYQGGQSLGASLSPASSGGKAILGLYGIDS